MVIVYLYDPVNGYRYRKISADYYYAVKDKAAFKAAWIVHH